MYVYIYIYGCTYMRAYRCTHEYMYTYMRVQINIRIHKHLHLHLHLHLHWQIMAEELVFRRLSLRPFFFLKVWLHIFGSGV